MEERIGLRDLMLVPLVLAGAFASLFVLGRPTVVSGLGQDQNVSNYQCGDCDSVANELIRSDISPYGRWVLGTTGGDPDTDVDDDTGIIYGFESGARSEVGTGYPSLRVEHNDETHDIEIDMLAERIVLSDRVHSVWNVEAPLPLKITQTLSIRSNPYSGRMDLMHANFRIGNESTSEAEVGLRLLLDVRMGINDGAPYFVPGEGAISTETEFVGEEVPPHWITFESPNYDPTHLRGIGLLRGTDIVPPDRFKIVRWLRIQDENWSYPIAPTKAITDDSAVALYWDPVPLNPGEVIERSTAVGIAGNAGGVIFITAPVDVECDEEFSAAVYLSNFNLDPMRNGRARMILPNGIRLAAGESVEKPIDDIDPGQSGSAAWKLVADGSSLGAHNLKVAVLFDEGLKFDAEREINIDCESPISPSPEPSATPFPTPDLDKVPYVCDTIIGRVPAAAINAALADPTKINGWLQLANPALPPGPNNARKRWLSIRDPGNRYHPIFNALIFKVGCP